MDAGWIVAIVGEGITLVGSGLGMAFWLGAHSARLYRLEKDMAEAKALQRVPAVEKAVEVISEEQKSMRSYIAQLREAAAEMRGESKGRLSHPDPRELDP